MLFFSPIAILLLPLSFTFFYFVSYFFWPVCWAFAFFDWCLFASGYWLVLLFPSEAEKKERQELGIVDIYIPTPRNCIADAIRSSFQDFLNEHNRNMTGDIPRPIPRTEGLVAFARNNRIAPISDDDYDDYDIEGNICTPRIQESREIVEKEVELQKSATERTEDGGTSDEEREV